MATMPLPSAPGQPEARSHAWFAGDAGACVLASEREAIHAALEERRGQGWLWLAPDGADEAATRGCGRGLRLRPCASGWDGDVRCGLPLPLASESIAAVVVQHAARAGDCAALFDECQRVLVPGGRLWLFALNPLSPYRWRWKGQGLRASEPLPWRRRLRAAGLWPDPVSQGIGPSWRPVVDPELRPGAGLRAAWMLRAEKRSIPMTAVRSRKALRIGAGVPAS